MATARRLPDPPLLVVTDRRMAGRPLAEVAEAAFRGGCRWLMVREKDLDDAALAALVGDIVSRAGPYGAAVSVNGDARVAAACGAHGVHLPQGRSVPAARRVVGRGALVGVSAHSPGEAWTAAAAGADYATLSPIFATASKPGYGPPLGLDELRTIAWRLPIPLVALGGITADTAGECMTAGAAGVAALGAVMGADDATAATRALIAALQR